MSIGERTAAANDRMVRILGFIDENNEAARLQGAAMAGALLGGWILVTLIAMGYTPTVAIAFMTIGTAAAFAIRTVA